MSKSAKPPAPAGAQAVIAELRQHAERQYAAELTALAAADDRQRPPNWKLSPWAVTTYLLGGKLADGTVIVPKYIGSRRLMEIPAKHLQCLFGFLP